MLIAGALLLAGTSACGGGDDDTNAPEVAVQDQQRAVDFVTVVTGEGARPPVIGESYDCGLFLARATPVPGRCLWTVVEQPPNWIVTFRETWACGEFAKDVQSFPACTNVTGFHEWVYEVDLNTGDVQLIDETGQFPPDYAAE